jgi:hypothetical protein
MADPLDDAFNVYPVAGEPTTKFARVDFRAAGDSEFTEFEALIETKCPRLGWARATICSCKGFNDQTDQTDPDCPKCNGLGWRYFRPVDYAVDASTLGALDALQTALLEKANAVVIRGLTTGIGTQPDIFQVLGKWALGSAMLTVRPGNRVGYYDRVVQLDVVEPFSEVIEDAGVATPKTRYPVHSLNFAATLDTELSNDDIILYEDGTLGWKTGKQPPSGTRVTLSYMHHPVWVVIEFVNANRTSLVKFKKSEVLTPSGDTQALPIRVMLRREYLPADPG